MISQDDLDRHPSWAQCTACSRTFLNDTGFEAHRVGTFEPDTRRCEIPAGYVEKGGLWGTSEGHEAVRVAILRLTGGKSGPRAGP